MHVLNKIFIVLFVSSLVFSGVMASSIDESSIVSEPPKSKVVKKTSIAKSKSKVVKKSSTSKSKSKSVDSNAQDLSDLEFLSKEMSKSYNVEDYPAGSENKSSYTDLASLIEDFAITNPQTTMGSDEEQNEARSKLKTIIRQAKKFKAGDDNLSLKKLVIKLRNDKDRRYRALRTFCLSEEDLNRVKERMHLTDSNINLATGEIRDDDGNVYHLRNLIHSCYPRKTG